MGEPPNGWVFALQHNMDDWEHPESETQNLPPASACRLQAAIGGPAQLSRQFQDLFGDIQFIDVNIRLATEGKNMLCFFFVFLVGQVLPFLLKKDVSGTSASNGPKRPAKSGEVPSVPSTYPQQMGKSWEKMEKIGKSWENPPQIKVWFAGNIIELLVVDPGSHVSGHWRVSPKECICQNGWN